MKMHNLAYLETRIYNKKEYSPLSGQIELTYACNFNCLHCYCQGSVDKNKELNTEEFKKILDEIQRAGCLWLVFSGGDPLVRDDFLELYAYAKRKGFIITIFTNGYGFTEELISYLSKSPPCSIEITLNGITKNTYEKITRRKNSFARVMRNLRLLKQNNIPFSIKSNCLKQNKSEIAKIKKWVEDFLDRPAPDKYYFHYDPIIFPRLNGDKTPCNFRLSLKEMLGVRKKDTDIFEEYQEYLHGDPPTLERGRDFLYLCNTWLTQFFINPYGRLKFCTHSDKFSLDLRKTAFKEGFYRMTSQVSREKFKGNSECRRCPLRSICYSCPATAYLETGNEEMPVEYYCRMAKYIARKTKSLRDEKTDLR